MLGSMPLRLTSISSTPRLALTSQDGTLRCRVSVSTCRSPSLPSRSCRPRCSRGPARHAGFSPPGGTNHDDVLENHFFGHVGRELLPPHAIAQGNGDGAFRVFLADNVLVEFRDDLTGGQLVESDLLFFRGSG